jgi:hypothetical protein
MDGPICCTVIHGNNTFAKSHSPNSSSLIDICHYLTFFAIFYVDDAYLASRDAKFLQHVLDHLVSLFEQVGLETNVSKTQTMICTLGRIRTQLPVDVYRRLRCGRVTAAKWNARDVECLKCGKMMKATSLRCHLADMHNVYQQTAVAEEMLIC